MTRLTVFCHHCGQLVDFNETVHPNGGGYMCDPCYRHMESITDDSLPPPSAHDHRIEQDSDQQIIDDTNDRSH